MYENIVGCECKIHGLTAIACSECLQDSLSNHSRLTAALDSERKRAESLTNEVRAEKAAREKAEAAGAEMRKALKDGAVPLEKLRLWILKNFPSGSDPTQEEPRYLYSALDRWLYGSIDDAKESTCGQPLLDELARLRKENEGLKRARQGLGD